MTDYTALVAKWATLTGTTQQKLDVLNGTMVAGPTVDVTVPQVVGYLLLNQSYLPLQSFALTTAPGGNATYAAALVAAKTLIEWLTVANAPTMQMSNAAVAQTVAGMAGLLLAQETAAPGSTGFTSAVFNGLLALAATQIPWWFSSGYTSPISAGDLAAAGGLA
jgi:hypothetical protein